MNPSLEAPPSVIVDPEPLAPPQVFELDLGNVPGVREWERYTKVLRWATVASFLFPPFFFVPFCMSISAIREGERLKVSTAGPTTCLFLSGFIGLLVCFIASLIYLFVCGLRFTC